ncbi:MAG: hypothetical protein ACI808_002993 [Paraglaciecola sp.]|jgi:hypothetical protein
MKYFNNINKHEYIYIENINEPEDNCLQLVIEEARWSDTEQTLVVAGAEISDVRLLDVTDKNCVYEVIFDSYIGYSVRDESYVSPCEYDVFEGRIFCIYSKSHYLDYISHASFACDDYAGPFVHYGFNCLNHVVDVVSTRPPKIKLISGSLLTSC